MYFDSSKLTEQVESLTYITPANAAFIPEYLLPQMRDLTMDQDVSVRATYAGCLVNLADAARNVLELNQAAKTPRNDPEASGVIEVRLHICKGDALRTDATSLTTTRC